MGNSILSKTIFKNTTAGLQGYSDSLATGATADPPSPDQGDNKLAPIAMQSYRDDGKSELWSYTSPDNIETYASELLIQLSPEGMWDYGTSGLDVRSAPRGKVVAKVNGTAISELQVWGRSTPLEPSIDAQTTNKGAWGASNVGKVSEGTLPLYGDGIQLAVNDTLSFEVTPYDHALANGGLFPQVWRFKVFAQGTVSNQRFFWTAAYRPLDLSASQVAVTFTTPVNGITILSMVAYCDTSDPFVASRVELTYNGLLVHEFGQFNTTIMRTRGDLIAIPIDAKLGTGGTLALRGNPLIDCGGIASIKLLGNLTDLTEAPYAAGYADGYADGLADGLATDQTGPVVQNITPTQGTVIGTNTSATPITFEVADTTGVLMANVDITIHFIDATSVNVWNGVALDAAYNVSSSVVQTNGQLVSVSLLPDIGHWTQTISRIEITADDTAGGPNSSDTVIGSWLVTVDDIGPIVQTIAPTEGTSIGENTSGTPITFEVADARGMLRANVTITVHYLDATSIVAWDGAAVNAAFDAASTVVQTNANLVTVSLVPDALWSQTISRIVVVASDSAVTPNTSTTTIGSWIVSPEDIAPVVQNIAPIQGSVIGAGTSSTPITFEVADAHGVARADVVITVHYVDATSDVVWDGATIDADFNAATTVVQTNANLVTVSIKRDVDWDQTISTIEVEATDGAVTPNTSDTFVGSWIVIGASKDTTPPVITAISPTPAVAPGDPGGFPNSSAAFTTPIILTMADVFPGLVFESVTVRLFGVAGIDQDAEDVAFRAGVFKPPYDDDSIIVGDQLTILPAGGWPRATYIVLEVDAVDIDGNLAHEELVYQLPTSHVAVAEVVTEEVDAVTAAINRLPAQFRSDDLP